MLPVIIRAPYLHVEQLPFEVVERKGIGHPDTLCDLIAETASRYYSQYCLRIFGRIAHHWFDKVMLVGGNARIDFGFGVLTRPFKVIVAGKAVYRVGMHEIPVRALFRQAAQDVLCGILNGLSIEDIEIQVEVTDGRGPGQAPSRYCPQLDTELFELNAQLAVSNDCNLCTGFAPLSTLEKLVFDIESYLNSKAFHSQMNDTGFDVKIVGKRFHQAIQIMINLPFLAKAVPSREYYLNRIQEIEIDLMNRFNVNSAFSLSCIINPEKTSGRTYLTVTGTVADTGDIGVVGRGNRMNGLITPMRSMSIEAACGKNPCDHTGKLYGMLAQDLSKNFFDTLNIMSDVHLVTWKEQPLTEPTSAVIYVHHEITQAQTTQILDIYSELFTGISEMRKDLIHGTRSLC